jgi:hypothetical protein
MKLKNVSAFALGANVFAKSATAPALLLALATIPDKVPSW